MYECEMGMKNEEHHVQCSIYPNKIIWLKLAWDVHHMSVHNITEMRFEWM